MAGRIITKFDHEQPRQVPLEEVTTIGGEDVFDTLMMSEKSNLDIMSESKTVRPEAQPRATVGELMTEIRKLINEVQKKGLIPDKIYLLPWQMVVLKDVMRKDFIVNMNPGSVQGILPAHGYMLDVYESHGSGIVVEGRTSILRSFVSSRIEHEMTKAKQDVHERIHAGEPLGVPESNPESFKELVEKFEKVSELVRTKPYHTEHTFRVIKRMELESVEPSWTVTLKEIADKYLIVLDPLSIRVHSDDIDLFKIGDKFRLCFDKVIPEKMKSDENQ